MWGNCGCSRIYRRYLDFHEPRNIIFCSYGLPPSAYLPTKSHADYVRNILVYKDALCDALSRQLCSPAHLNVFHPVADGDSKQYVEDSQRSNAKVCHAAFKNCWMLTMSHYASSGEDSADTCCPATHTPRKCTRIPFSARFI